MKNPFEIATTYNSSSGGRPLEWEESAVDSHSFVEDIYDNDRREPSFRWLLGALLLAFAIIAGRMFYLQVVKGSEYRLMSENNRVRKQTILAPRGLIRDRFGMVLAQNTASFNLVAVPFDLPKEKLDEQLDKVAESFGLDAGELREKLKAAGKNSLEPIVVKQGIPPEESILFETRSAEFTGFSVQKIPIRDYPDPEVFSHILGYTGLVSPEDEQRLDMSRYDSVDFVGKSGIESVYESYLHGTNGQNLVEVDATGKLLSLLGENSPQPGMSLELNIDKELQKQLYNSLKGSGSRVRKSAAVALNPKNGEVLALLSLPGFDNNLFAKGIKKEEYAKLIADKNLPLFNRAIAGTYPPGSTVKPIVSAAVLQEGIVTDKTIINDRGVLVIPNQFNPAISYNFYGWKRDGLGPMDVYQAIARSSDIYFYTVAGGHPNSPIKGIGAEKMADYYRKFNLGRLTGIDLQGEKPGVVADPEWKKNHYKNDPIMSKWYLGDTYHIGIGQGDMLSTPLQAAQWTAIVANNGVGFRPRVLKRVVDSEGRTVMESRPEVSVEKFIDDKYIKMAQKGMRETVLNGSGARLTALPISSAGKTGTSQFDGSDPFKTHAWFVAYAPYEDPEIVIAVLVEAGGEGHAVAVPVVKDALQWWAENRHGR